MDHIWGLQSRNFESQIRDFRDSKINDFIQNLLSFVKTESKIIIIIQEIYLQQYIYMYIIFQSIFLQMICNGPIV